MRALGFALVALALVSAGTGAVEIWSELGAIRAEWDGSSELERARAAPRDADLPPEVFEFFAARLRAGDRYYVHVPRGRTLLLANEGGIVRMFASYALLPAVQVATPGAADVVVAFRADPRELGLRYEAVERLPGPERAAIARVAD